MILETIKTYVDIFQGAFAALAILAAAWWFFWHRSLAGTLQISLTLLGVTKVEDTRIATIRVKMKNTGQTRVKKDYCIFTAEVVNVRHTQKPFHITVPGPLKYSLGHKIFKYLVEIEPNEETYQDVVVALSGLTFFAAGVRLKKRGTREAWEAIAVFNADEKAKIPSTTELSEGQ